MLPHALNINSYITDGFKKVCDVRLMGGHSLEEDGWRYANINEDLMFSRHRSWVYFIVSGDEIVKVGETGNPLGIRTRNSIQPAISSTSRLGRLRNKDGTDAYIRQNLNGEVVKGLVSIWAKKCDVIYINLLVGGKQTNIKTTVHKNLELEYLDWMMESYYHPRLNKCRK